MQQDAFLRIVPALATEAIGISQFYCKRFTDDDVTVTIRMQLAPSSNMSYYF